MAFIHCAHGAFCIADRVALTHTGGEACPESVHARASEEMGIGTS